MAFAIVVSPRAAREIAAANAWWRANRPEAHLVLADDLSHALARVAENPNIGAPADQRRRLLLHRTGYLLVYRVRTGARRVEVLAFWHGRRRSPP